MYRLDPHNEGALLLVGQFKLCGEHTRPIVLASSYFLDLGSARAIARCLLSATHEDMPILQNASVYLPGPHVNVLVEFADAASYSVHAFESPPAQLNKCLDMMHAHAFSPAPLKLSSGLKPPPHNWALNLPTPIPLSRSCSQALDGSRSSPAGLSANPSCKSLTYSVIDLHCASEGRVG